MHMPAGLIELCLTTVLQDCGMEIKEATRNWVTQLINITDVKEHSWDAIFISTITQAVEEAFEKMKTPCCLAPEEE